MKIATFSNGYGQQLRLTILPRDRFLGVGLLADGQTNAVALGGCRAREHVHVSDYSISPPGATFVVAKHSVQPIVEWMHAQGVRIQDDRTAPLTSAQLSEGDQAQERG